MLFGNLQKPGNTGHFVLLDWSKDTLSLRPLISARGISRKISGKGLQYFCSFLIASDNMHLLIYSWC